MDETRCSGNLEKSQRILLEDRQHPSKSGFAIIPVSQQQRTTMQHMHQQSTSPAGCSESQECKGGDRVRGQQAQHEARFSRGVPTTGTMENRRHLSA